ncbi:tyrosine-type recombinase/integrase [Asticcacaulis excentricus]|uniref:Integrase n=1 Tax=Asticcacaulis excentricus TaxID=78587 RepID=A0A3G9FYT2_9CAUL|nr:site-specific integrase [Asticcacaulis excentricus]BBF79506.1 integrase [Asticcacaulis excentricus]
MPKKSAFRITKEAVDALPADKDAVYWDRDVKGFGVRVKPGGQKSYLVQYRNREGRSRRLTLGQHGHITPKEAERLARAALGQVAGGADPVESGKQLKQELTVAALCAEYVEAVELGLRDPKRAVVFGKSGAPKKASTHQEDLYRINRHIIPHLGKRKVGAVTSADVRRFMDAVAQGRTATRAKDPATKKRGTVRTTGGSGVAARTVGLLGGIFSYAVDRGHLETNPCRGVKRPPDKRREVRLSAEQYALLGKALRASEVAGEVWQAVGVFRLIALTGCRLGEAQNLKWTEVDLPGQVLRLSDTKTGCSVRPIGSAVVALLNSLPREGDYVFPSPLDQNTPYGGLPGAWKRVLGRLNTDEEANLNGLTPHGLRHAYASTGGDLGLTEITISALLGHSSAGVTQRYIHFLDTALIAAANQVSREIEFMMA